MDDRLDRFRLCCGVQLVFSKSVTTVFVYWILGHINKNASRREGRYKTDEE